MKAEESWLRRQKFHTGPWLRLSVTLGWLNALVLAIQAWLLADVVTAVSFEGQALSSQWPALYGLLFLFPLRALLGWGSGHVAAIAAVRLKQRLRNDLFIHLRQLGPAWLASRHSGSLSSILSSGVEALGGYYARYLPATIWMAAIPLTLLLFIAPRDWLSGLILLATAPLIPFFMILIGEGAERRNQRQWRQLVRMSARFLDSVRGLTTLKLFDASRREAEVIRALSDEYRQRTLAVLRIAFLSSFTLEFFATVSIAVVAVVIGFRLYWGELSFAHGFFVLLLVPEFYLPLRNLGSTYHDRMEAIGAAEQLLGIFQQPLPDGSRGGGPFLPAHAHGLALQLQQLGFSRADGRGSLHGLEMTIPAASRVAVVGPSGAGKSTLFNLLLGFLQPVAGEIRVDGQLLSGIDPESWRRQLAWVPQSPHLFHGTVLENIRLADPGACLTRVEEAAEQARCLEFVRDLPDGFDTLIGEGGRGLSGGQRQRIALARAFLRRARLVLLDEPTANLDLESERCIQQVLDELAGSTTLITIAHRLQTARKADLILVLDGGRLVQQGNHEILLAQPGPYARMLDAHREVRA